MCRILPRCVRNYIGQGRVGGQVARAGSDPSAKYKKSSSRSVHIFKFPLFVLHVGIKIFESHSELLHLNEKGGNHVNDS
jgi:hypothetical protein